MHLGNLEADVSARCQAEAAAQLQAASEELAQAQRDFDQLAREYEQAKTDFMKCAVRTLRVGATHAA